MQVTAGNTRQRARTAQKTGGNSAHLLTAVKLRNCKHVIFHSRGSQTAQLRHSKSKVLRWEIFGSSESPTFLLSEDHFNICMLFLLEAPVGTVVAVWAPGRTKGRKWNKSIPSRTTAATETAQMGKRYRGAIINAA